MGSSIKLLPFKLHHRSKVGYTENRLDAGFGVIILSAFIDFLHQNSVENRVVLEVE